MIQLKNDWVIRLAMMGGKGFMKDMMKNIYTDMENILARFLHSYHANRLQYVADHLLYRSSSTYVNLADEELIGEGYDQIYVELKKLEQSKKSRNELEMSTWATPYYQADIKKELGRMACDTYTYRLYKDHLGSYQCEMRIMRMDVIFRYQKQTLKISNFKWYTIQSMLPWEYRTIQHPEAVFYIEVPKLPIKQKTRMENSLQIRNLQNYFFERRMHQVIDLFSEETTPTLFIDAISEKPVHGKANIQVKLQECLEEEARNGGFYKMIGITSAPVIEVQEDGKTAKGAFLIETFQIQKKEDSKKEDAYNLLRSICHLKSSYILENGRWKIKTMYLYELMELPMVDYKSGIRYDRMSKYPNAWSLDNQPLHGQYMEEAYLIENVLSNWAYSCRWGKLVEFYEQHMKNGKTKVHLLINSQGDKLKGLETEIEIRERLTNMDCQFVNLFYSYHTTTTPIIEISRDGTYAKGSWYDHSATNLRSMAKSTECIPYMVFVAKYVHEFEKIDGKWYLINFYWEPILHLPEWEYDAIHSKGWVSNKDAGCYPIPFA